jgi:hypothetical protein
MTKTITLGSPAGDFAIRTPNKCPICHKIIDVNDVQAWHLKEEVPPVAQMLWCCPNHDCNNFFLGEYFLGPDGNGHLNWIVPFHPEFDEISEVVRQISPNFAAIYQEAMHAKDLGLLQICGPGLRKAFEFLIKDYAKKLASDEEQCKEIENTFAGTVVKVYIHDARVRLVAERALWVGNDETHYLRKWEDKNIDDLVNLIKLTLHYIEMDELSQQYAEDMPEGRK